MLSRTLNPLELLKKSSYFLFGPRGSGKSTLIRKNCLTAADYIDLLDSRIYLRLKGEPSLLGPLITKPNVVIDEMQRIPELLNEVHRLIENDPKSFLLTGSSSRQLKRKGTNLLAGRALRAELFPLTWWEIANEGHFHLNRYLQFGGLPMAYLGQYAGDYLNAYGETYLKEEVQAESLTRNLPNYIRFLQSVATNNGQLLNF